MACYFVLLEEIGRIEETCVGQKLGMWTGINLMNLVKSVANHQQAEGGSEASWCLAEVGSGADCQME